MSTCSYRSKEGRLIEEAMIKAQLAELTRLLSGGERRVRGVDGRLRLPGSAELPAPRQVQRPEDEMEIPVALLRRVADLIGPDRYVTEWEAEDVIREIWRAYPKSPPTICLTRAEALAVLQSYWPLLGLTEFEPDRLALDQALRGLVQRLEKASGDGGGLGRRNAGSS